MRVGIYARISTKDGRQEVENQLAELRRFAAAQGWDIFREYVDRESGKTDDRAEFQKMFADSSKRRFDVVLFWALDRFTREGVLETLQHLTRLSSYGVGFRSYCEPFLDSCGIFRDAVISILATLARQERVRIAERTRAGLERARRNGKRIGRPRVTVDANKAASLRSQGHSLASIAREMAVGKGTIQRTLSGCTRTVPEATRLIA